MDELEDFGEDSSGTIFRDVIMLALIGFVAMVVMLLPHLRKSEVEAQNHKAPGNVIVELHWPTNQEVDVDLWAMGPNSTPVGFWKLGNRVFNLLRDDLGTEGDATDEIMRSPTAAAFRRANTSLMFICTALYRRA